MDDDREQAPSWLLETRRNIVRIRQDWEAIRLAGQAQVRRGLETIKMAEQRLAQINYVEQTLGQNLSPVVWADEIIYATGTSLAGTVSTYQMQTSRFKRYCTGIDQHQQVQHARLIDTASSTGISVGSMNYSNAAIEHRLMAIASEYQPVLESVQLDQIGSRQKLLEELCSILQSLKVDQKYMDMLAGSEWALGAEGPDHLSHAAHSMRDLFQFLIEHIAPTEAVKQQPWFIATPGAPGGVSRASRLRYLLYGSGRSLDEAVLKQLNEAADRARGALDLSIARAHDHDPLLTRAEVESSIDHARFALLEVLKRFVARSRKSST